MITYNDPASADLIPVHASEPYYVWLPIAIFLTIALIGVTIILFSPRFTHDIQGQNAVRVVVMTAISASAVILFILGVTTATYEYMTRFDITEAEARLGVAIEPGDAYTVTLPDGTRHTECDIEPAPLWNTNDFEEQPYRLMCNGEQITAQR